jgi:predicted DNA-binding transcriptional regulator AlpA
MNERAITGRDIARERITVSVNEFIEMSGLSRRAIFRLIKDGRLGSIKLGKKRLIVLESYRELVAKECEREKKNEADRISRRARYEARISR